MGIHATRDQLWGLADRSPLDQPILATLPNGDLVAGGEFTTAGGVSASRIARYEPCLSFHSTYGTDCYSPAMTLGASPNPVSTATAGTLVTYAIDNIPDSNGSSGVHVGATLNAQAIALTTPNLLNAAGLTTSHGVRSLIYEN